MFSFCWNPDFGFYGLGTTECYIGYYWILVTISILFLLFLVIIGYVFWKKIKSQDGFCKILGEVITSPVSKTFCQHLTKSGLINNLCFYFLVLASIFTNPWTQMSFTIQLWNGDSSIYIIYCEEILSIFFRILYLFLILVALEVIYLRSYYIKKNKLNLLSSAVDVSERALLTRFMFKKALILSLILFLIEVIIQTVYMDQSYLDSSLYFVFRLSENLLILFMGIPKLRLLNYERLLIERSRYISMNIHTDALLKKHLLEVCVPERNISALIEGVSERNESECPECGQQGRICSHIMNVQITNHFDVLRSIFVEQQEIANANLVAMLPTNARNTVGSLKIILIIILIDFAINSLLYGLYLIDIGMTDNTLNILNIIRLILRTSEWIDTPVLIWVVFDVKKAFGEFHSVLEKAELRQQKQQKEKEIIRNITSLELADQASSLRVTDLYQL